MQTNITVLDDSKFYGINITKTGTKLAKLSTFNNVKNKTDKLMAEVRIVPKEETQVSETKTTDVKEEVASSEPSVANDQQAATPETDDSQTLPFTSEEVLVAKKDLLGITAYKDIDATINPIESIQTTSRRLKTNPVVPGNINRERNINGGLHVENVSVKEDKPNAFDFSALPGVINNEKNNEIEETNLNKEEKFDNDSKIDEWLNKENSPSTTNDEVLNEVNDLKAVRDSTADSLATQKEILADLKKRIEENKALCEAKKEELKQENMALTQELNDVLAEINKLSDLEAEQKAFLGIEDNKKTM